MFSSDFLSVTLSPNDIFKQNQPTKVLITANILGRIAIRGREKKCDGQCNGRIPCLLALDNLLGLSQKTGMPIETQLHNI
jgi:hypothetical protein